MNQTPLTIKIITKDIIELKVGYTHYINPKKVRREEPFIEEK